MRGTYSMHGKDEKYTKKIVSENLKKLLFPTENCHNTTIDNTYK
jgi:hypothetical protein